MADLPYIEQNRESSLTFPDGTAVSVSTAGHLSAVQVDGGKVDSGELVLVMDVTSAEKTAYEDHHDAHELDNFAVTYDAYEGGTFTCCWLKYPEFDPIDQIASVWRARLHLYAVEFVADA